MNNVLNQVIPAPKHKSRSIFDINKAKEEIINFFKKPKPQKARTLVARNEANQTEEVDIMEQEPPILVKKSEPQQPIIDQYIQEDFLGGQQEKIEKPEPQKETEQEGDRLGFWKNELQRNCSHIIEGYTRKSMVKGRDGENDYIKDARYQIQNIARQARSECIHQVNKRLMKFPEGKVPKDVEKKIRTYRGLENKRRRLEQSCIRGWKKRSVQHLVNGSLLKNLINSPENNRFQYTSENSKKIYEVIILGKAGIQGKGKMIYELEAVKEGEEDIKHPFKFAKTIDHNNEESIFSVSGSTKHLESIEEIQNIITKFISEA